MKRLSILLIILIASLLLLSCGENDSSHGESNNSGGTSADSSENGGNENNENVNDGAFDGIDDVIDYGDNNMNDTEHNDLINSDGTFTMIASVTNVSEYLEVDVIRAPYGNTGPFWVIISSETKFADSDGNPISKSDIKTGDTVKITYGGQVMMSYPPKIVAYSVTVEK